MHAQREGAESSRSTNHLRVWVGFLGWLSKGELEMTEGNEKAQVERGLVLSC